jgi:hypothetical protein
MANAPFSSSIAPRQKLSHFNRTLLSRFQCNPVASRQEDTGAEEKEGSRCLKF